MTTVKMSVERADSNGTPHEIRLEITGTHNPFVPAKLHGHPDNSSPAEGGDTEIENVKVLTKMYAHLFTELTSKEEESAKELVTEESSNDLSDEREHDDAPDYYDD